MFEVLELMGRRRDSIVVQTSRGRNVDNEIALPPTELQLAKYERLRRGRVAWRQRKRACGRYNCFGMVFAARRTAIYDQSALDRVFQDDVYRRLDDTSQVVPGDLAAYLIEGCLCHIGLVVRVEKGVVAGPWILSKWDDGSGEDEHALHDVPYETCRDPEA